MALSLVDKKCLQFLIQVTCASGCDFPKSQLLADACGVDLFVFTFIVIIK
jgi:hypothetical protein